MKVLVLAATAGLLLSPAAGAETANTNPSPPELPSSVVPQQPQIPNGGQADGTVPRPDQPAANPPDTGTSEAGKGSGPDGMAGPHNPAQPSAAPSGTP